MKMAVAMYMKIGDVYKNGCGDVYENGCGNVYENGCGDVYENGYGAAGWPCSGRCLEYVLCCAFERVSADGPSTDESPCRQQ